LTYYRNGLIIDLTLLERKADLARQDETETANSKAQDIERLIQRLDMLDKRLDSVDSIVSAVAERVMRQPLTLNLICPRCGQRVEIAILGTQKPSR
jgi:hypothetical protein